MRTFLAKNGMLNHVLIGTGLIEPLQAQSMLDWRGIVVAFVWKQTPFVTLLLAGAMASIDAAHIEAARNLGARRLRVLFEIVLPQVARHAAGRARAVVRDDAVGAVGADDDQSQLADDDHGRHRLPHQHRIGDYARRQCAVPHVAGRRGGRRVVLPAAGVATQVRHEQDSRRGIPPMARRCRPAARRGIADAPRRCCARCTSRFAIFGPLPTSSCGRSPRVVLPQQAAAGIRPHVLGARIQPARRRDRLARHQHLDRAC